MNYRKKILTASITACLSVVGTAHAQDAATQINAAKSTVQSPDGASATSAQTAPAPANTQGGGAADPRNSIRSWFSAFARA